MSDNSISSQRNSLGHISIAESNHSEKSEKSKADFSLGNSKSKNASLPHVTFASLSNKVFSPLSKAASRFNTIFNNNTKSVSNLKFSHVGDSLAGLTGKSQESKKFAQELAGLHRAIDTQPTSHYRDAVLEIATNLVQPGRNRTQALRVISTALSKLDVDNKKDREIGEKILKALANVQSKANNNDLKTWCKMIHQKAIIKIIVRNAPTFSRTHCGEMISQLFAAKLPTSVAMRQDDVQGALVRHVSRNLEAYPVAARMKIGLAALENFTNLSTKPPAGHNSALHRVPAGVASLAAGSAGMSTAILAATGVGTVVTAATLWPVGVAFGVGAAAAIGLSSYQKVRNQSRDSIQAKAFNNIVLEAMRDFQPKETDVEDDTAEQESVPSKQVTREQSIHHAAKMLIAAQETAPIYRDKVKAIIDKYPADLLEKIKTEQERIEDES